jgi:hypothetical protein
MYGRMASLAQEEEAVGVVHAQDGVLRRDVREVLIAGEGPEIGRAETRCPSLTSCFRPSHCSWSRWGG